jgi:hypothetical protein
MTRLALQKAKELELYRQFRIEEYKEAGSNRRSLHANRYTVIWGVISMQFLLAAAYNYMLNNILSKSMSPQTIEAFLSNLLMINIRAYAKVFNHQQALLTAHSSLVFIPLFALFVIFAAWLLDRRLRDLYKECTNEAEEIEKEFGIKNGVYTRLNKDREKIFKLDHTHAFIVVIILTVAMWLYLCWLGLSNPA